MEVNFLQFSSVIWVVFHAFSGISADVTHSTTKGIRKIPSLCWGTLSLFFCLILFKLLHQGSGHWSPLLFDVQLFSSAQIPLFTAASPNNWLIQLFLGDYLCLPVSSVARLGSIPVPVFSPAYRNKWGTFFVFFSW